MVHLRFVAECGEPVAHFSGDPSLRNPITGIALLRPRAEGPPRRHRKSRHDLPPSHSITSSARARSVGGIVRPSAFAVLTLITSSYLEGCSTGRSAGLAPLKILST